MSEDTDRTTRRLTQAAARSDWRQVAQEAAALLEQDPDSAAALSHACQAALALGRSDEARGYAGQIAAKWPDNASAWVNLARVEMARQDYASAAGAYRRALQAGPPTPMLLVQASEALLAVGAAQAAEHAAAAAMELAPDLREAYQDPTQPAHIRAASKAANAILRDQLAISLRGTLETLEDRCGRSLLRMRRFLDVFLGFSPLKTGHPLQKPSRLYVPDLRAKPWWEPSEIPAVKLVEDAFPAIYDEWQAVSESSDDFLPYIEARSDVPEVLKPIAGKQDWSAFHFYRNGQPVPEHIERCPKTMAVIHQLPLMIRQVHAAECFFSVLRPHCVIPAHVGHTNIKFGVHLGLSIPEDCAFRVGGEQRIWEPGKCLIFDDGFVHEVWNHSEQPRVVLIFDLWHPDLELEERSALDTLLAEFEQLRDQRAAATVASLLDAWPQAAGAGPL
ncbi:MAG: aspartyl/asparaginyl beta-hydroxylase domain-containing protein [Pseudomonadota bacterium]